MHSTEFKSRRVQMGLSQARLATALGVTPTTVARWERGESTVPPYMRLTLNALHDELTMRRHTDQGFAHAENTGRLQAISEGRDPREV